MKTVGEIKKYAESLPMLDGRALAGGLVRLKNGGVPFLGCVCFVQYNREHALKFGSAADGVRRKFVLQHFLFKIFEKRCGCR